VTEVYWICLLGGLVLALVVVFLGDLIGVAFDGLDGLGHDLIDPLTLVGGVTAFGGAGVILLQTTELGAVVTALLAFLLALTLALGLHFAYVRPMRRAENSTGFSQKEYAGKVGEVNTTIPARGYGEVLVRMGSSTTFQPAASDTGEAIPIGTPVVVVEVEHDGALRVVPFEDGGGAIAERGWRPEERPPGRKRLRG